MQGHVYCNYQVILEVEKWFDTDYRGNRLQIRGRRYRYVAWIQGGHPLLRYHNVHEDPNEYIHRVFDPRTGKEILFEVLTRVQFPTFPEVLDEMEFLVRRLGS